ncbi:uncharacterized protein LOC107847515 isoform X2 [Capsicum annuum]|uniref:uncharacterized protein LOC107847515 isoform X2 n=1 Tax=Capsicum annuum TaxID=4072 RepID=UPI0007BEAF8A|nr:uncharacterized protein LOC107847515 isoform X2 [Capsicum annuum]
MSEKIKKSQKQKGKVEKSRREKGEEADVAFIYGRCFFIISSKVSTFRSKLKMNYLGALEGIHLKSPKSLTRYECATGLVDSVDTRSPLEDRTHVEFAIHISSRSKSREFTDTSLSQVAISEGFLSTCNTGVQSECNTSQ